MRCLVVYETVHGTTEQVARAVAEGLVRHGEVAVADVRGARPEYVERFDLLVAGAPAHAFSLSHGPVLPHPAPLHHPGLRRETGLRTWLRMLPEGSRWETAATFDVRALDSRQVPGSTARRAAHVLRHLGYLPLDEPTSFYVKRSGGPLMPGELARAAVWGDRLGTLMLTAH
jgi:hypothetical protein